ESKVCDGGAGATITGRSLTGVVSTDHVSLSGGTATFSDKNAGAGKTVTGTGFSLSGGDAGNYVLDGVDTALADVSALHVTGAFTAQSKVYDGNTSATITGRSLTGVVSTDDVALDGGAATFDTKNVGADKTVTLAGAS